jgi:hypothetical protein
MVTGMLCHLSICYVPGSLLELYIPYYQLLSTWPMLTFEMH